MEYQLDRALQGTLTIFTKVQPKDLDAPTPCASWNVRALVNHLVGTARWWAAVIAGDGDVADAYRGPDGHALFGPAREAPTGAGAADQLAAFLGRAV